MHKWYEKEVKEDIILSSDIRLDRNLCNYSFGLKLKSEDAEQLVDTVYHWFQKQLQQNSSNFRFSLLSELVERHQKVLEEEYILNKIIVQKKQKTALILSEDEAISILINGENHLKLIGRSKGLDLLQVYSNIQKIDNLLSETLQYAYDEKYGYLTSSLSHVGTGMKATLLLFLPALTIFGKIERLCKEVERYGMQLGTLFQEENKVFGNLYSITNAKTFGVSEQDILEQLNQMALQIVKQEMKQRETLLKERFSELEDKVYRSYGVLKYARQISMKDAMTLLSQFKFGLDENIIKVEKPFSLYTIMKKIQPAFIQNIVGENMKVEKRDQIRANILNEAMSELQI